MTEAIDLSGDGGVLKEILKVKAEKLNFALKCVSQSKSIFITFIIYIFLALTGR